MDEPLRQFDVLTSLSQSKIWEVQENYYMNTGVAAWEKVPYYPTNNAFLADIYADLIVALLTDMADDLDPSEPVWLMEVAAGAGCLSYYLIHTLERKRQTFPKTKSLTFRYVVSDFVPKNIEFYQTHEGFKSFVERGIVDFACFRPDKQDTVELIESQCCLRPGELKNPLIVWANYFFDTLRQDIFRKTKEGFDILCLSMALKDADGQPVLENIDFQQRYEPVSRKNGHYDLYPLPTANAILSDYDEVIDEGGLILPVGGFQSLENLNRLATNGLVFISADKGFSTLAQMNQRKDFFAAFHHGAFSFPVNFEAMGRYVRSLGGTFFISAEITKALHPMMAVIRPKGHDTSLDRVSAYFQERLDRQDPLNSLYYLQQMFYEANQNNLIADINACLAFIRLSCFDPLALCTCAAMIYEQFDEMTSYQERDLRDVMEKSEALIYFVPSGQNLFYWFGKLWYGLNEYKRAIGWFETSNRLLEPDPLVCYLMATSYEALQEYDKAKEGYEQALALEPDFEEARLKLEELQVKPPPS